MCLALTVTVCVFGTDSDCMCVFGADSGVCVCLALTVTMCAFGADSDCMSVFGADSDRTFSLRPRGGGEVDSLPAADGRRLDSHRSSADGAQAVHGRGLPDRGLRPLHAVRLLPGPGVSLRGRLLLVARGRGTVLLVVLFVRLCIRPSGKKILLSYG